MLALSALHCSSIASAAARHCCCTWPTLPPPHPAPQEEAAPAAPAAEQQNGGGSNGAPKAPKPKKEGAAQRANQMMDKAGLSLGPIGLTIGSELQRLSLDEEDGAGTSSQPGGRPQSYASLTTAEWRALYEKDGAVDLWVAEEFNSGSRLIVSLWAGGERGLPRGPCVLHADGMRNAAHVLVQRPHALGASTASGNRRSRALRMQPHSHTG